MTSILDGRITTSKTGTKRLGAVGASLACAILVFGCLSGCNRGAVYQASKLPIGMAATPIHSAEQVNLSALARSAMVSEMVYPGDILEVRITTGLETDEKPAELVRVDEQGVGSISLIGEVVLAGLYFQQAEKVIYDVSRQRQIFVNPHVAVGLKKRKTRTISVSGEVENPGPVLLPETQSDLLNALIAAGGLTSDADTIVEIRNPGGTNGEVGLVGYQDGPSSQASGVSIDLLQVKPDDNIDLRLADGAVVMVRKRPPQTIQVIGLVNNQGRFPMKADEPTRLIDAIAMANGRTLEIADVVRVIRPTAEGPKVIEASFTDATNGGSTNILLGPGDIVSVDETPSTFVVGIMKDFMRIGLTAGIPGL
jgi:polysaccharide export outer membrane protein